MILGGINMATLVKVDKNGTKYWFDPRCPKCGGRGYIYGYEHIEGGICFMCGGRGLSDRGTTWKEYTPEYEAKLEARRAAKRIKNAEARNIDTYKSYGMSESGEVWVVLGNTYSIKEMLKTAGARFNCQFGWHFDHETDAYPTAKLTAEECGWFNTYGEWYMRYDEKVESLINKLNAEYATKQNASNPSNHVGEVGQRIKNVKLTLVRASFFESHYGTGAFYTFKDENDNELVWKTSPQDLDKGTTYVVTFTVKEHSEYQGKKQTNITRCKISA